jgi:hypothetical protein
MEKKTKAFISINENIKNKVSKGVLNFLPNYHEISLFEVQIISYINAIIQKQINK